MLSKLKAFKTLVIITMALVLTQLASEWIAIHEIKKNAPPLLKTSIFNNISYPKRKTNQKRHSICVNFAGRLANNMFQFASAFGIAKLKNMSVIVASDSLIRKVFNLGKDIGRDEGHCRLAKVIFERWKCAFDKNLLNIDNKHDYRFKRYLQSWKYFKHAEDDLRKHFRFKENIATDASKLMTKILLKYRKPRSDATLVGIHVRRGDMAKSPLVDEYAVATKEYLTKAIYYYKSNFENVIFIVCSDDINWCKENINNNSAYEFMERSSRDVDLALLSSCDHIIQSVGSFSWWAAWLAGGTSVFYKWPAKNGSVLRTEYSKDYLDYFYPGWIGM